jgi:hypothetical protein
MDLQSLAPTPVSKGVDFRQAAGRKIISESLLQHNEKHVVPTPHSGIRVELRKDLTMRNTANMTDGKPSTV